MAGVPQHRHPEREDRITAEQSGVQTEIVALREDVRRGFAALLQAVEHLASHIEGGGHDA
jgi:hypothetical protein